ncbi:hypothetical protein Tco_0096562 [Tanacetum coccineum]
MHNNIMTAGSKDRPPMLRPGRYSQWRSRFLRYIDTKANGEYLRKCIFDGLYKLTSVVIKAVAATVNAPAVPEHDEAETVHNMMSDHNSSDLAPQRQMVSGENNTSGPTSLHNDKWRLLKITLQAPFLNVQMTFEHISSSLGHQCLMMSDHNSSDLAPQRQEMSVENVSSGLVPQGQKASDYDNSDPVPPR